MTAFPARRFRSTLERAQQRTFPAAVREFVSTSVSFHQGQRTHSTRAFLKRQSQGLRRRPGNRRDAAADNEHRTASNEYNIINIIIDGIINILEI